MRHYITFKYSNTSEVTVQVKRDLGKTKLHKLPIYNEFMFLY